MVQKEKYYESVSFEWAQRLKANDLFFFVHCQLKYKRRVYKMLNLDEKQLRSLQSRVNIRRFFDYVSTGQTEKITKLCSKGLDPNTHLESGGNLRLFIYFF